PTAIGARIDDAHEQLAHGSGYDHNFVVRRDGPSLALAARVVDPLSGRTLEIHTTAPGIQLYTGNFLDGTIVGKGGRAYTRRAGFSLEPQHFPDSPNHPTFPTTTLRPGERYRAQNVVRFGAIPVS
ncbi:MAG: galactose-1-epimerase, partial [Acidobacteriota bacterium]